MTYALITNGTIQAEGSMPAAARRVDTGEWLCPPGGVWDDALAADVGWMPVVEKARPADTPTSTSERSVVLVAGKPTAKWTTRPKTAEEVAGPRREAAAIELARAIAVSAAPAQLAALQAISVPVDGSPWRQPRGAHDAYPLGAKVTWKGKTWENLTPANVWEPGVSSWREVVAGGGIAAWVQPTGSTDAYKMGAVVSWKGHKWTSTNAANVWEPGVFGWTDNGVTP